MKPNLYISTGGLILNLIRAENASCLSTQRLFDLGQFIKRRLHEVKADKDYGNIYMDLRDSTVRASLRYLSDYVDYHDDTICYKQEAPKKLVEIYELDPVVAGIFDEFVHHERPRGQLLVGSAA